MSGPADGRGPGGGGPGDAFVAFLREAASDYHRPPPTPHDALWEGVRAGLAAREHARASYHAPPETPADEMWPAVAAAWRERDVTPLRPADAGADGRADEARRATSESAMPAWVRVVGVAAVLAVGVLVGRASIDDAVPPQTSVATDDRGAPAEGEDPGPADAGGEAPVAAAPELGGDATAPGADGDDPGAGARPTDGVAPAEGTNGRPDPADAGRLAAAEEGGTGRSEARRRAATFRAATYAHLGRSELFLAGFRVDSLGADPTARRARDLLSETRLYLDWARGDSPHLTALLQDLELVLAQIARLDESTWARERALVLDGMERRGVLSLLRSTVPGTAGPWTPAPASGT